MNNRIDFSDESEIYNLKFLSKGNYANVYRSNDATIKFYKLYIRDGEKNPNLRMKKLKIKLMKQRKEKIKNTDLPTDLVYVNNKFFGFYYDFIDGKTLYDEKFNLSKIEKVNICYQIINNSRELTDNKIYCLDYKLDNIIYNTSKKVKIIDTDDEGTKVTIFKNPVYFQESLYYLKRSILELLYDDFNIKKSYLENIKALQESKNALLLFKRKLLTYKMLEQFIDEYKIDSITKSK